MRSRSVTLTAVLAFALTSNPSPALASTSEVFDANDVTPTYVDIVHAKVTQQVGRGELLFMMELAAPIPDQPTSFTAYAFQIESDPSNPGFEFAVIVRWFGGRWEGFLNHGRFGAVINTPIQDFRLDGATVKVRIDPARFGMPETFSWRPISRLVIAPALPTDTGAFAEFTRKS
jgi:hypothetical protein